MHHSNGATMHNGSTMHRGGPTDWLLLTNCQSCKTKGLFLNWQIFLILPSEVPISWSTTACHKYWVLHYFKVAWSATFEMNFWDELPILPDETSVAPLTDIFDLARQSTHSLINYCMPQHVCGIILLLSEICKSFLFHWKENSTHVDKTYRCVDNHDMWYHIWFDDRGNIFLWKLDTINGRKYSIKPIPVTSSRTSWQRGC